MDVKSLLSARMPGFVRQRLPLRLLLCQGIDGGGSSRPLTNLSNAAANTAVHVVMNGTPLGCISGAISHQKDPIGVGQCIVVKTTADVTGCGFGLEAGRVYGPAFGPEGALAGSAAGCVGFGLAAGNGVDPENTASSGG
jgi:hypothetical protein